MIELRPYQAEGLAAIWDYFSSGQTGNPLIAWPTGTGKSIVPAIFIKYVMGQWPNQRFLMITHVKELIQQNYDVLRMVWPNAPVSIYSAGLGLKNPAMPIVFGGVQSMCKHPAIFGHRDIIFIDEAHLINQHDTSMYKTFLSTMKLINPNVKIIGMSATPFRMGWGLITDPMIDEHGNDGRLFTDIVHDITGIESFNRLIAEGYLSPLIPVRTHEELDISEVGINGGEYIQSQLQAAVDKKDLNYKICKEITAVGEHRRCWLTFASGIEHAEHLAENFRSFGISAAAIHSKQKSEFNDEAIKDFKNFKLRCIINYGKLTTGFNHPWIDYIPMVRATLSVPLWVQMLGRGTRPAEGKLNCIAEGSLVLTNVGLIPIEKISLDMKVWDGVEFVSHSGLIYQGYKEVIEYHGLVATMEHKVYTKEGWKTFGECFKKRIGIAITEFSGEGVQLSKNYFSGNNLQKAVLYSRNMYSLFSNISKRVFQRDSSKGRLPFLWSTFFIPKMVRKKMQCSISTLYKSKKQSLQELWWSWNKIQFCFTQGNGDLYSKKSWFGSDQTYRQKGQQWTLRDWKFKIFKSSGEYAKSQVVKKHVFDITNAGRYNRFTVNGLLVSNCLVGDYARNTPRLGPINDPVIPRKKGEGAGDVPVKLCDSCGAYNHTRVQFCCQCGNEFQFKNKLVAKAGTQALLKSDIPIVEDFSVTYPTYARKQKDGGAPYILVTYHCGLQAFKEFVFPEGKGPLKHKYHLWWRQRANIPPPETTDGAMNYTKELMKPKKISVWVNKGKYHEVLRSEF